MSLTTPKSAIRTLGDRGMEHVSGPLGRVMEQVSEAMLRRQLSDALADYDAAVAKCPVNNFAVERRVYRPNDRCSACGATASGNCGKDAGASYRLVAALRQALERAA